MTTKNNDNLSLNGTNVLPDWADKMGVILRFFARFFPNKVAGFMAAMWFKPFMPKAKPHVIEWQNKADKKIQLTKGQAFLFLGDENKDIKENPLVVCVHGWRGRAHQMRRFLPVLLDRGFRVVMVNLPAHSDDDENKTHLYECGDVIKELNQEMGPIDSVIAHSFGSPSVALALEGKLPLRKFIMVAANLDINHLLTEYAKAFKLEWLLPKINQQIKKRCDKDIFEGSWDSLNMDTVLNSLASVEELQFWHDPKDTEICIATNEEVNRRLIDKGQKSSIQEVENVGHFDILKSKEIVEKICNEL